MTYITWLNNRFPVYEIIHLIFLFDITQTGQMHDKAPSIYLSTDLSILTCSWIRVQKSALFWYSLFNHSLQYGLRTTSFQVWIARYINIHFTLINRPTINSLNIHQNIYFRRPRKIIVSNRCIIHVRNSFDSAYL